MAKKREQHFRVENYMFIPGRESDLSKPTYREQIQGCLMKADEYFKKAESREEWLKRNMEEEMSERYGAKVTLELSSSN